jgi:hypothetical protein
MLTSRTSFVGFTRTVTPPCVNGYAEGGPVDPSVSQSGALKVLKSLLSSTLARISESQEFKKPYESEKTYISIES